MMIMRDTFRTANRLLRKMAPRRVVMLKRAQKTRAPRAHPTALPPLESKQSGSLVQEGPLIVSKKTPSCMAFPQRLPRRMKVTL